MQKTKFNKIMTLFIAAIVFSVGSYILYSLDATLFAGTLTFKNVLFLLPIFFTFLAGHSDFSKKEKYVLQSGDNKAMMFIGVVAMIFVIYAIYSTPYNVMAYVLLFFSCGFSLMGVPNINKILSNTLFFSLSWLICCLLGFGTFYVIMNPVIVSEARDIVVNAGYENITYQTAFTYIDEQNQVFDEFSYQDEDFVASYLFFAQKNDKTYGVSVDLKTGNIIYQKNAEDMILE